MKNFPLNIQYRPVNRDRSTSGIAAAAPLASHHRLVVLFELIPYYPFSSLELPP
jgi:hypothetical protein